MADFSQLATVQQKKHKNMKSSIIGSDKSDNPNSPEDSVERVIRLIIDRVMNEREQVTDEYSAGGSIGSSVSRKTCGSDKIRVLDPNVTKLSSESAEEDDK